ncbi:hypothetical protein IWX48DRAFT_63930 [Phyllosticta citricarpa]
MCPDPVAIHSSIHPSIHPSIHLSIHPAQPGPLGFTFASHLFLRFRSLPRTTRVRNLLLPYNQVWEAVFFPLLQNSYGRTGRQPNPSAPRTLQHRCPPFLQATATATTTAPNRPTRNRFRRRATRIALCLRTTTMPPPGPTTQIVLVRDGPDVTSRPPRRRRLWKQGTDAALVGSHDCLLSPQAQPNSSRDSTIATTSLLFPFLSSFVGLLADAQNSPAAASNSSTVQGRVREIHHLQGMRCPCRR